MRRDPGDPAAVSSRACARPSSRPRAPWQAAAVERRIIATASLVALVLVACKDGKSLRPDAKGNAIPKDIAAEVMSNMDTEAAPCDDFYRYACGGWLDATQLPPEEPRYGRFHVLRDRNKEVLRSVLERAAANGGDDKLGNFWNACMDENAVEQRGLATLQPTLQEIEAVRDG